MNGPVGLEGLTLALCDALLILLALISLLSVLLCGLLALLLLPVSLVSLVAHGSIEGVRRNDHRVPPRGVQSSRPAM